MLEQKLDTTKATKPDTNVAGVSVETNPFRESLEVKKQYQEIRSGNLVVNVGEGTQLDKALQQDIKSVLEKSGVPYSEVLTDEDVRIAQGILGVKVDGDIGPETMRALDTSLGRTFAIGEAGSTDAVEYWLSDEKHQEAIAKCLGHGGLNALSLTDIKARMDHFKDENGEYQVGSVAALYESGGAGAGTISTLNVDSRGKYYGTFQLASGTGTLQKFLAASGYDQQFGNLTPNTEAFDSKWRSVAQSDPDFGKAQHRFIMATHYEPHMEKLKENQIDFSSRGDGLKEEVFSTANQYGANTSVIINALRGHDISNMGDNEIISVIQEYKRNTIPRYFPNISSNIQQGVLNRTYAEEKTLHMVTDANKLA